MVTYPFVPYNLKSYLLSYLADLISTLGKCQRRSRRQTHPCLPNACQHWAKSQLFISQSNTAIYMYNMQHKGRYLSSIASRFSRIKGTPFKRLLRRCICLYGLLLWRQTLEYVIIYIGSPPTGTLRFQSLRSVCRAFKEQWKGEYHTVMRFWRQAPHVSHNPALIYEDKIL